MSKLKTKSSVKKRFRLTATGRVRTTQAGKRHGMRKRSLRMKRNSRGTTIMNAADTPMIKSFMPYA